MKYPIIILFLFVGLLAHGNPSQLANGKSIKNQQRVGEVGLGTTVDCSSAHR